MFSKNCFALKHSQCRKKKCDCYCHQPPIPKIYKRVDTASLEEIEAWMRHPRIQVSADTESPQRGGLWPEVAERLLREVKASWEERGKLVAEVKKLIEQRNK